MKIAYLDNNIWNLLVDDPTHELNTELLIAAYHAGDVRIVGSLAIEEEILGTARSNVRKYDRIGKLYRRLIGPRSLLPLNERHMAEYKGGGPLQGRARYSPPSRLRAVKRHLANPRFRAETADAVFLAKEQDFFRQVKSKKLAASRLSEISVQPSADVNEWFNTTDVEDWVRDLMADGARRGHFVWNESARVDQECLPSAWLLTTFSLARYKRTLGDGRKIQKSDRHDAEHVAAGAYFDFFVTLDQELATTIGLFPNAPFVVMDPTTFARTLGSAG